MAKKYFIWKDPACNGMDIEWVELNGAHCGTMKIFGENGLSPSNGQRFHCRGKLLLTNLPEK